MGGIKNLIVLRKKRIVEIVVSVLGMFSTALAFWCLIFRIRDTEIFGRNFFNILAVESILPNPIFYDKENYNSTIDEKIIEINNDNKLSSGENGINSPESKPYEVNSNDSDDDYRYDVDDYENHQPNEKTYKIIESQISTGGTKVDNIYIKNASGTDIDFSSELNKKPDIDIKYTTKPQVLIFHTHTTESYMIKDQGFFYESFYPRSYDNVKNVTRVGEAITKQLKISFNYNVTNYVVSPYYITKVVKEDYLIAHDPKTDISNRHYLSSFKISMLKDVKILDEETLSIELMTDFPNYKNDRLQMYTRDTTPEHIERLKKNLSLYSMSKELALKEFPLNKYLLVR